ncbi:MAG: hypothetical protein U9Q38_02470 [Thermodesulfobacteriota bacterium]|nr:hypothetical protein [Thermodesulfobacteriota bacterium]
MFDLKDNITLVLGGIVFIVFIGLGWYIKSLNDENIECKVNTKLQKQKHKLEIDRYEKDIKSIVSFYDGKITDVDNFKKGKNETDCQAAKRFLDGASY